jgi:chorismate-pyruvate lyase
MLKRKQHKETTIMRIHQTAADRVTLEIVPVASAIQRVNPRVVAIKAHRIPATAAAAIQPLRLQLKLPPVRSQLLPN